MPGLLAEKAGKDSLDLLFLESDIYVHENSQENISLFDPQSSDSNTPRAEFCPHCLNCGGTVA